MLKEWGEVANIMKEIRIYFPGKSLLCIKQNSLKLSQKKNSHQKASTEKFHSIQALEVMCVLPRGILELKIRAGDYFIPNCGYICGFQLFVSSFSLGMGHSYNDIQTK